MAGDDFGDGVTFGFNGFVGFATGDCDGVGVLVGDDRLICFSAGDFDGVGVLVGNGFSDGVTFGFNGFVGLATGDCDGAGVFAGDGVGDAGASTIGDLDLLPVRCCNSGSEVVGNGIAVGSSIAAGRFEGVGVGVTLATRPGVGAPSGSNKRPRLCDTVGETIDCDTGVEVTLGTGICADDVATSPAIRTDGAR